MSRKAKIQPVSKKPYCKVCHDAGKPESDYTSHWVRTLPDRTGKTTVTCPTLLATECRYCYNLGHTAKFCPVLKYKERAERRALERPKQKVVENRKIANKFASLLEESSDSEEEVKVSQVKNVEIVEEFPALAPAKSIVVSLPKVEAEVNKGWAAIAAKPPTLERMSSVSVPLQRQNAGGLNDNSGPRASAKVFTKSWADWTDSDTEDDSDACSECEVIPMKSGWSTNINYDEEDEDW
jgi:Nanos RNA binding domain